MILLYTVFHTPFFFPYINEALVLQNTSYQSVPFPEKSLTLTSSVSNSLHNLPIPHSDCSLDSQFPFVALHFENNNSEREVHVETNRDIKEKNTLLLLKFFLLFVFDRKLIWEKLVIDVRYMNKVNYQIIIKIFKL